MSDRTNADTENLSLSGEAAALLEEVKEALGAQDLSNGQLAVVQAVVTHFVDDTRDGGETQNSYRDTAYQDRYQDTPYRDSSTYADTPSYRDAAK
jgi:hypothetical protein